MGLRYTETAGEIDIDQLCALRLQAGFVTQPRDVIEAQVRGARWVVAAWDDERLIGFVRAISDGVSNAYVCTMVVDEDYRGRGIGTELMTRLIADRDRVRWVLHSSDRAIPFYERLGFTLATKMMRRDRR
jgi:ribosomal protein S18 acetylase RimI-like enzyme